MNKISEVYLHTGSNIGDKKANLQLALAHIETDIGKIQITSSIYQTEAWGLVDQDDFFNQALLVHTVLEPIEVLKKLKAIEERLGRVKTKKWTARIIDIDILFWNNDVIKMDRLTIPHPHIEKRNFVLVPMQEIAAKYVHPISKKTIKQLSLESTDTQSAKLLEDTQKTLMNETIPYDYIAIEGNIGAGKTTLSKMLAKELDYKLILEQFTDNPFLPFFYENPERYAFPVELFFMTERHKQLQENLAQQDLFQHGILADYFFLKTLLFARNNLNEEEYRLFQRLFNVLNSTFPKPELLVYLHRSVDVLLGNIKARGRAYEQDISEAYLLELQNAYFEYFKIEKDIPILIINLENIHFSKGSKAYKRFLEMLKQPYEVGIHHLNFNNKSEKIEIIQP